VLVFRRASRAERKAVADTRGIGLPI